MRFAIARFLAGDSDQDADRLLEMGQKTGDMIVCKFIDHICAASLEGSWSLDGVRNSIRSVEDDQYLELLAMCWALGRNRSIVPVHLKVTLERASLKYDLYIESQKEFVSEDRMWKQLYSFAHEDTVDWSWRFHDSGTIQIPS